MSLSRLMCGTGPNPGPLSACSQLLGKHSMQSKSNIVHEAMQQCSRALIAAVEVGIAMSCMSKSLQHIVLVSIVWGFCVQLLRVL